MFVLVRSFVSVHQLACETGDNTLNSGCRSAIQDRLTIIRFSVSRCNFVSCQFWLEHIRLSSVGDSGGFDVPSLHLPPLVGSGFSCYRCCRTLGPFGFQQYKFQCQSLEVGQSQMSLSIISALSSVQFSSLHFTQLQLLFGACLCPLFPPLFLSLLSSLSSWLLARFFSILSNHDISSHLNCLVQFASASFTCNDCLLGYRSAYIVTTNFAC